MRNTYQNGRIRILIFQRPDDKLYEGVVFEFGIVTEGEDKYKLLNSLKNAAHLYLKSVLNEKLSEDQLNYEMDKEYEDLWNASDQKKGDFLSTVDSISTLLSRKHEYA